MSSDLADMKRLRKHDPDRDLVVETCGRAERQWSDSRHCVSLRLTIVSTQFRKHVWSTTVLVMVATVPDMLRKVFCLAETF
jgi:hypothetical protein